MKAIQRTVVVTGAAGRLGSAVAAAFHAEGAGLVLLDRDAARLEALFGPWKRTALALATDLFDADRVRECVARALDRFGSIDVLCNIAGGFEMGPLVHEIDDAGWNRMFSLNCRTLINASRAVVPHMIERGKGAIVNVGSAAALRGQPGMSAYGASKAVVMRLTESMSAELMSHGINVNCVLPSTLDTPENRAAMPKADPAKWVAPDDLARIIAFLCSPAARPIHGAALPVTAGV